MTMTREKTGYAKETATHTSTAKMSSTVTIDGIPMQMAIIVV